MKKMDLRSLNEEEMMDIIATMKQPKFRAKQLFQWVHQKTISQLNQMHNMGKTLLTHLDEQYTIENLILIEKQVSKDGTQKYLFELTDGHLIECVLMSYQGDKSKRRNTLCVSSQVGCAMGCAFCATGKSGFQRNLTVGEIVSQIYEVNKQLLQSGDTLPVGNIVFMGMGEPLLNTGNVMKAIEILNHSDGQMIGIRRITISTCGIVPEIKKLADRKKDVVLAISLHGSNDKVRSQLMPINDRYPLAQLMDSCKYYQQQTKNRISFEYALVLGVNDQDQTVQELAKLLKGLDCHLNIIPINPIAEDNALDKPNKMQVTSFVNKLKAAGLNCSIRQEKGSDIDGACGQLRGKRLH